jgi:hypothetical protein
MDVIHNEQENIIIMRKQLLSGLLATTIGLSLTGLAHADTFYRHINMANNDVAILPIQGINVGDTVQLNLNNPTHERLTFQTTEQYGVEATFDVNPLHSQTVRFKYKKPLEEDIKYVIYNTNGEPVSQHVLSHIDVGSTLGKNIFHQKIQLTPGRIDLDFKEVDKGETIVLNLNNPSDEDYVISIEAEGRKTREDRLIPSHSARNIAFEYPHFYGDDVDVLVKDLETAEADMLSSDVQERTWVKQQKYNP